MILDRNYNSRGESPVVSSDIQGIRERVRALWLGSPCFDIRSDGS